LRDGDPLPSIRELTQQLRINRNTVAKAYTLDSNTKAWSRPSK